MKISFLGAVETVTGSMYLVDTGTTKVLVDCGLYQGQRDEKLLNYRELPVKASDIGAIFLTHGHLDHCGMIPKLVKDGFSGIIFGTEATIEVAKIILLDSAKIQESDASKYTSVKNPLSKALYTTEDALNSFELFRRVEVDKVFNFSDLQVTYRMAGHILGASSIYLKGEKTVLFSGDLGRLDDPLMPAPSQIDECDYIVMESTYGNRNHSRTNPSDELEKILEDVIANKRVLLVPTFAVARAQLFIHYLNEVFTRREDLKVPSFVSSPMTNAVTELYKKFSSQTKLTEEAFISEMSSAKFLEFSKDYSKLNKKKGPLLILAASGMISGGRILEYLDHFGKHENNIILLIGYQAKGTIGHDLENDIREVSLLGHRMNVRADVLKLENLSAHSDQSELLKWLSTNKNPKAQVILVHGEQDAQVELKKKIEDNLNLEVSLSKEVVEINC